MRVLFLVSPHLTIFEKKPGMFDMGIGSANVAGVIEAAGHEVELYNCNVILNQIRDDETLTEEEFNAIVDFDSIVSIINGDKEPPEKFSRWISEICSQIDTSKKFDALCISLDRRTIHYYPSYATFFFAMMIMQELNLNIPTYIGGEHVYKMLDAHTPNVFLRLKEEIFPDPSIQPMYVTGINPLNFIPILETKNNGKYVPGGVIDIGDRYSAGEAFKANSKPSHLDLKQDIFLDKHYEVEPRLKSIEHFCMVPYKFSEGCIFKCSFCASGLSDKFSYVPVEQVVDNIEKVYDQGYTNFRFFNDNINFKLRWTIDFCNEIVKRGIKIRFSDSANTRVASKEMFDGLRDAGCIKLWYGVEHNSNRILKEIRKEVDIDTINQTLEWSNDAGIWNSCNFIYNFPHETEEEFVGLVEYILDGVRTGKVDNYQLSQFKIVQGGEYYANPSRFKIIILNNFGEQDRRISYEEDGGDSWQEIIEREERRNKYVEGKRLLSGEYGYRSNDAFLFGCREAGLTKPEIKQLIEKLSVLEDSELKSHIARMNALGVTNRRVYEWFYKTLRETKK